MGRVLGLLNKALPDAAAALHLILETVDTKDRVAACRSVLEFALKYRESEEQAEKL